MARGAIRGQGAMRTQSRQTESWTAWIHQFAPWTHAVTITCKRFDPFGRSITPRIVEDAARHFLRRLNHSLFGKHRCRRGHSVGSAVCYGFGLYGDHPHLHMSLACPDRIASGEFTKIINRCADRTFWLNKQRTIKHYRDEGWSAYLLEHGSEQLILSLLHPVHFT